MDDPYDLLGVRRDDTPATIHKAYLKLAKRHHPDLNPDKPEAVDRFKAINAAHDLLNDPERRARFDRGEIDAAGHDMPPPRPHYRDAGPGDYGSTHGFGAEDLESLFGASFSDHFGGGGARAGGTQPRRGGDIHYSLTVDFLDAANGAVRRLNLPDGRTLDVTIPAGLRDGHVLRLRGQGRPGRNGGPAGDAPPGDALVEISVAAHPFFRREGDDVLMDLPVSLQEAILGASVMVPTVSGPVRLTIKPNAGNGAKLRLAKRGIAGGSQIVTLRLVLPAAPEPALAEFMATWAPEHPVDLRAAMEAGP
jgi:DnaJ-class molecular chaperone